MIEKWKQFKDFLYRIEDPAEVKLYGPSEKTEALCRVPKNKLKPILPPENTLPAKENVTEKNSVLIFSILKKPL